MRVRQLTENTMNFCLPSESVLKFHRNRTQVKFSILSQYDSITDEKRDIMVALTRKLLKKEKNYDTHGLQLIERFLTTEYETTPEPLRELLMFNLLEQTLSQKYYKEMFFKFLELCNYDVNGIKKSTEAEDLSSDVFRENRVFNPIKYNEIEKIDSETADEIKKLTEKKNATSIQKLQLRRYFFDFRIDLTLSMENLEFYFKLDESSYNKGKLNNAYYEAVKTNKDIEDGIIWNTTKTGAEMGLVFIYPKLQYIREINEKLGLKNSIIRDVKIPRNKIEEIDEYLQSERENIHTLFNLKDKSVERNISLPDNNNVRKNLEFLNKIYDSWTGMKIVNGTDIKRGKVTEFVTRFSYAGDTPLLPPPYQITYDKVFEKICMIRTEGIFDVPLAVAEPFDFLEVELVEEIPEAIEIL
jgi:signal recognition particle subunit SEC65